MLASLREVADLKYGSRPSASSTRATSSTPCVRFTSDDFDVGKLKSQLQESVSLIHRQDVLIQQALLNQFSGSSSGADKKVGVALRSHRESSGSVDWTALGAAAATPPIGDSDAACDGSGGVQTSSLMGDLNAEAEPAAASRDQDVDALLFESPEAFSQSWTVPERKEFQSKSSKKSGANSSNQIISAMESSSSCLDTSIAGTSFIRKLYEILNDEANNSIISWKPDGMSFEICSPKRLETEILPKFFRHSRFQSLIRQLNFYAFKKTTKERSSWIYSHDLFQREKPELLDNLRRKTNSSYTPRPVAHDFIKPDRSSTRPHLKISSIAFPFAASHDKMDEIDDYYQNSSFYLTSMSGSYFSSRPASSSSSSASVPAICGATVSNASTSHESQAKFSHNPLELLSQVASLTPPGALSSVLSNALKTLKKARESCSTVEESDLVTVQTVVSQGLPYSSEPTVNQPVYPPVSEVSHAHEHERDPSYAQSVEPHNDGVYVTADEERGEAGGADVVEVSEGAQDGQDGHDSATSSITMKNGDSSSGDESSTSKGTSASSASSISSRREAARTRTSKQGEEAELQRLLAYFDSKMSISSKKVVMFCILHNPWLNPAQLCVDICNLLASDFLIATEMDRYMDLTFAKPQPHLKARTHAFLLRSTMLGQPLPLPLPLPLPATLPGVVTMPMPDLMDGTLTQPPSQVDQSYVMPIYPHSHSLSPESYFATSHSFGNVLRHMYSEGCHCQSCLAMSTMIAPVSTLPSEGSGQAQIRQPTSAPVPLINSSGSTGDKAANGTTDAFTSSSSMQTAATSSSSLEQSDTNYMRSTGNKNGSNTVTSSLTGGTSSESDNGGSGSSRNSDNNDDRNSDSPLNQEGNDSDESSDGAKNPGGVKNDLSYFNMRTHNNATQGNPSFPNSDTTGTGSDDNSLSSDNGSQNNDNNNNNGSSSSSHSHTAAKRRSDSCERLDGEQHMKRTCVDNADVQSSSVNASEFSLTKAEAQIHTEKASGTSAASVTIGPADTIAARQLQQTSADEYVKLAMAYNLQATNNLDATAAAATMSYVQTYADMAYEGCDFLMLNMVEIESMKMFVPFALTTVHTARDILHDVVRRHANSSSSRRKSSNDDTYNYRLNSEQKFLANLDACVTAWSEYSTTFCT